jgi:TolB-like protein
MKPICIPDVPHRARNPRCTTPSRPSTTHPRRSAGVTHAFVGLWALAATILAPASAVAQSSGGASAEKVCDAYWAQQYDAALKIAAQILAGSQTATPEKIETYKCQACTYVAKRQMTPARASISGMLVADPSARFTPPYTYPPPVLELYNTVRDSMHSDNMDIRTIAVGDFEDNSPYKGKFKDYDFSMLRLALVHTVMADLAEATPLKIVDRQRTEQLVKEIQLGQSGFADPAQSVRFGQLLGAQTFIFGQFMVLTKDKVRIDARVVHTATGQVILTRQVTGEFSGDPEKFLALERDLVNALASGIGQILADGGDKIELDQMTGNYFEAKRASIKGREKYVESKFKTAEALELEDKGDYKAAKTAWKQVLEMDPGNEVAGQRLRALNTMG